MMQPWFEFSLQWCFWAQQVLLEKVNCGQVHVKAFERKDLSSSIRMMTCHRLMIFSVQVAVGFPSKGDMTVLSLMARWHSAPLPLAALRNGGIPR